MSHLLLLTTMSFLASDLSDHPLARDAWLVCACVFLLAATWDWVSRSGYLQGRLPHLGVWILRGAWIALTVLLAFQGLRRHEFPIGSVAEILLTLGWGLAGVALFLELTFEHRLPTWAIAGATALAVFAAGWLGLDPRMLDAARGNPLILMHVGAAVLAYCILIAQALNSLAYLLQHHALAARKFGGIYAVLPALVPMDRIGNQLMGAAVWMLGLSLVIGATDWAQREMALVALPKLATSLITWLGCLFVLVQRRRNQLSGATFARASLWAFVPALIALYLSLATAR